MNTCIEVTPSGCIWGSLLLLTVPLPWLAAVFISAAIHELCHIMLIRILGGHIWSIRIGMGGAVIETEPLSRGKELACALAGPLGSLLLSLVFPVLPRVAFCAAVQGIYNLLPVFPMDGGRILHCIAEILFPLKWADRFSRTLEIATVLFVTVTVLIAAIQFQIGLLPLALTGILFIKTFLRKIPCKPGQLKVQ